MINVNTVMPLYTIGPADSVRDSLSYIAWCDGDLTFDLDAGNCPIVAGALVLSEFLGRPVILPVDEARAAGLHVFGVVRNRGRMMPVTEEDIAERRRKWLADDPSRSPWWEVGEPA